MQSCTTISGNTLWMASGKPFKSEKLQIVTIKPKRAVSSSALSNDTALSLTFLGCSCFNPPIKAFSFTLGELFVIRMYAVASMRHPQTAVAPWRSRPPSAQLPSEKHNVSYLIDNLFCYVYSPVMGIRLAFHIPTRILFTAGMHRPPYRNTYQCHPLPLLWPSHIPVHQHLS